MRSFAASIDRAGKAGAVSCCRRPGSVEGRRIAFGWTSSNTVSTGCRGCAVAFERSVGPSRGGEMLDYRDLFQWERFITPSIIKIFYWLAIGISVLFGLSGIITGFTLMAVHPLGGIFWIVASMIGILIGVIFARIVAEFVLILFRINEHLSAIRNRGQM
jgi:hypothetical protein